MMKIDLQRIKTANNANPKIRVSSLIMPRKEYPLITAITQNFHIIKKPLQIDQSLDISNFSKNKDHTKNQPVGRKNFFLFTRPKTIETNLIDFPKFRKNAYLNKTETNIDSKIKIHQEIAELSALNNQNKHLKQKIMRLSKSLKKFQGSKVDFNQGKNSDELERVPTTEVCERNDVDENKRLNTAMLNDILNSKKIPIYDPKWQVLIRKAPSRVSLSFLKRNNSVKDVSKIIDVSYPYCSSCKVNWNKLADLN